MQNQSAKSAAHFILLPPSMALAEGFGAPFIALWVGFYVLQESAATRGKELVLLQLHSATASSGATLYSRQLATILHRKIEKKLDGGDISSGHFIPFHCRRTQSKCLPIHTFTLHDSVKIYGYFPP